jgi:hypothetical protein
MFCSFDLGAPSRAASDVQAHSERYCSKLGVSFRLFVWLFHFAVVFFSATL